MRSSPEGSSPASDFRLLLTVIAGISLGVAAAAMPGIITGPFANWTYAARLVMWLTGVLAVILEYLAVNYGVRMYLQRADFAGTTSLAFVFLALAGMFAVVGMDDGLLSPRWFVLFAAFNALAGLDAEHARRVIARHAPAKIGREVVDAFVRSLRQAIALMLATAVVALLFAVFWSDAPPLAVFVAACLGLISVVAANVHQYAIRAKLPRLAE